MKRIFAQVSGFLIALSGFPFPATIWLYGEGPFLKSHWLQIGAGVCSVLILVGARFLPHKPKTGRIVLVAAALAIGLQLSAALIHSPALTLVLLMGLAIFLSSFWGIWYRPGNPLMARRNFLISQINGAVLGSIFLWLIIFIHGGRSVYVLLSLFFALIISFFMLLRWFILEKEAHRSRRWTLGFFMLASVIAAFLDRSDLWKMLSILMVVPLSGFIFLPRIRRSRLERIDWWEPILGRPERLLVITFFGLCLMGTLLLITPFSSTRSGTPTTVDAAFTAVSAVCVTGLVVLNTPVDFSLTGQFIILLLIQFGGLGIMTFSTVAIHALGNRMSLRYEGTVAALISSQDRSRLFDITRRIIYITVLSEGVGAVILSLAFWQSGDPFLQAVWRALFTSVSAFCNAGFALQSDSLIPYQHHAVVLHTVAMLIILGGLSPAVVLGLPALVRRSSTVPLQTKIAFLATAALNTVGFILILFLEWNHGFGKMNLIDRMHNAWFQTITLRTAGFNSIDIAILNPVTLTIMICWMFIGGNPGGTAGGIKTTTASVLVLAVLGAVTGREYAVSFGRKISHRTVYKAFAITTVGMLTLLSGFVALLLTQNIKPAVALFEVVSALGTVGLSLGGTMQLDGIGKIIIIICMFAGRVGPLTFFMFLSSREAMVGWKLLEEEVDVG